VPSGHRQHHRLAEHRRPGDQVGLVDGQQGYERVDLAVAEDRERVAEVGLAHLHVAAGTALPVAVEPIGQQVGDARCLETDAEEAARAAARVRRPCDTRLDLGERRAEVVAQDGADRGERHPAARPVEERRSDLPFQLSDGLADAGLRHP
jgi:hypothetical protein